jgi:DHA1 family bicyclomycin/chloramphenicol resistance-like MFS transporter
MAIAPIVAPIIGAQMLLLTSWRGTFFLLGAFGILLLLGSVMLAETAEKNPNKNLLGTFANIGALAARPAFIKPLMLFALAGIPILLYVGSASDIFVTHFGLSEQVFSLFFGLNAASSVIGPFCYMVLVRRIPARYILGLCFSVIALSGLGVLLLGNYHPFLFALTAIPTAMACATMRPPSMNILLSQAQKEAGAASSLMNFTFLTTGSLGMVVISLNWSDRIFIFGLITLISGLSALLLWPKVRKRLRPTPGLIIRTPVRGSSLLKP